MDLHNLWYVLAAILIVVGIIGTVLPALPGVPLVFVGMLLAAWADGFQHVGLWTLIGLGVLTIIAVAVDFLAGLAGAKRVGASRLAILGTVAGTIAGLFFGLPGLFLGPFLGAIGGELLHSRDLDHASRVGIGTWTGMIVGMLFKLVLVFAMLGLFLFSIAMH